MSQQLAIIVVIDVAAAVAERTLRGNTFLFDNMKLEGSEGEGTGDLVTAIDGTHWSDGSQADEQVLNWVPYSLGSIPPTVPRNFHVDRARSLEREALDELVDLAGRADTSEEELRTELTRLRSKLGTRVRVKATSRSSTLATGEKLMDVTGALVVKEGDEDATGINNRAPIITDVSGEAVDKNVIYPALYGSPDMISDGWYWSASIDTTRPGTYGYTMHVQLYEFIYRAGTWVWQPVHMAVDSKIRITNRPKRNGFTRSGLGFLPIPRPWPLPTQPADPSLVRL